MKEGGMIAITGAAFGTFFGPLISGALASFSWSSAADTDDVQKAAYRLYERTGLMPSSSAMDIPEVQPCSKAFRRKGEQGARDLIWILDNARDNVLRAQYGSRVVQAIQQLPKPILGALDGCVSGSPASSLCLSYVNRLIAESLSVPRTTEHSWKLAADSQINVAWCAAAQGI